MNKTNTNTNTLLARLQALAKRHPIALFLTMTFGLSYPLMMLPLLAHQGIIPGSALIAGLGLDMERAAAALMLWLGLFPSAILVTALEGGRPAVKAFFRRILNWRIGLNQWLIALLALPVITVVVAMVMGDTLHMPSVGQWTNTVVDTLVALLIINLAEEASWVGFLQTRLERRHNFFVAAALAAIPFAAIHMPLQIINGNTTLIGLAQAFALLLVLGLVVRPLFGMMLRISGDSILATGLMHTMFNSSNNMDGIAADVLVGPNRQLAALVATVLLTVVIGVLARRKLTRTYRQNLDELNGATSLDTDVTSIEGHLHQPAQV